MTWGNFILSLFVIYLLYYAVNIILDLMKKSRGGNKDNTEALVFEETIIPKIVEEPITKSSLKNEVENPLEKEELSNQNKDRKEEKINEKQNFISNEEKTAVVDRVGKENLSGGLQFDDLLKLVRQESIIKTSQIDFG